MRGIIHFFTSMEIVFSMDRALPVFENTHFAVKDKNMSRNVCLSEDIQIMPFFQCTEEHREHLPILHGQR